MLGRELGEGQQLLGLDESMRPEARERLPLSRLRRPREARSFSPSSGSSHGSTSTSGGLPVVPPTRSKYWRALALTQAEKEFYNKAPSHNTN